MQSGRKSNSVRRRRALFPFPDCIARPIYPEYCRVTKLKALTFDVEVNGSK